MFRGEILPAAAHGQNLQVAMGLLDVDRGLVVVLGVRIGIDIAVRSKQFHRLIFGAFYPVPKLPDPI